MSLEGINYILRAGQEALVNGENPYMLVCEQSGVMDKIESLQYNENQKVYEKAAAILEDYFPLEDELDIVGMVNNSQGPTASE